ncbi:MFS transporter [Actinoplanes sp. NPDC051475]|uniref:MFS transporter n=1 Tax=Actinoplanes sp. NPDC051475 TaxID=3157225 RepID=UPI00344B5404
MVEQETAKRPEGTWRTLRSLPRPVIVLLFGIAVNRMGSFISIFLILYMTHLGYSPSRAGIVLTAFGVGSIAGVYAGGRAADRFGPRRVIVVSMLLAGVAVGAVAVEHTYTVLLVTSALAGAFTQAYRPAASSMIAQLTPARSLVTAAAASRLALNVGATVGPLIGAWVAVHSYTLVFAIDAATCLFFGVVALVALPETGAAHATEPGAPGETGEKAPAAGMLADWRYLLVLAAGFATALVEVQYQIILPLQLTAEGEPTTLYGAVIALNGALVILFELPLTRFVQRLPMRAVIAVGDLFIALGLASFGIADAAWAFMLAALVWTAGEIVSGPSANAYPALAGPQALRGRYIGALSACQTAAFAIGPVVGTTLFQAYGRGAWMLCVVLGAVAFAAAWTGVRAPAHAAHVAHLEPAGSADNR